MYFSSPDCHLWYKFGFPFLIIRHSRCSKEKNFNDDIKCTLQKCDYIMWQVWIIWTDVISTLRICIVMLQYSVIERKNHICIYERRFWRLCANHQLVFNILLKIKPLSCLAIYRLLRHATYNMRSFRELWGNLRNN